MGDNHKFHNKIRREILVLVYPNVWRIRTVQQKFSSTCSDNRGCTVLMRQKIALDMMIVIDDNYKAEYLFSAILQPNCHLDSSLL